jgi:REP element-mobilizing transposase RayT
LLDVLGSGLDRLDASALAWCLMGNHDHFAIQTRLANLSRLMRHIKGVFTHRFNQRHHKAVSQVSRFVAGHQKAAQPDERPKDTQKRYDKTQYGYDKHSLSLDHR